MYTYKLIKNKFLGYFFQGKEVSTCTETLSFAGSYLIMVVTKYKYRTVFVFFSNHIINEKIVVTMASSHK
jgi:hypothetical protein